MLLCIVVLFRLVSLVCCFVLLFSSACLRRVLFCVIVLFRLFSLECYFVLSFCFACFG